MIKPSIRTHTGSIRTRLLALLAVMTVVAISAYTAITIGLVQGIEGRAEQISVNALQKQAEDFLVQVNDGSARENDLILEQVAQDAQAIADYTAQVFTASGESSPASVWSWEKVMAEGENGQWSNSKQELSSLFVPNLEPIDREIRSQAEKSASLELTLATTFKNNPSFQAVYFSTPRNVLRYYPNIDLGVVLPPDFKASQRIWFTGSTGSDNPTHKAWWSPVYLDATGLGLVTTLAVPVYSQEGQLLGVVGVDITLKKMMESIEATHLLQQGYAFLVDRTGRAIALPAQGYTDILGRPVQEGETGTELSTPTPAFAQIIAAMTQGKKGIARVDAGGRQLFVAYAPLKSTGWSLGSVVSVEDVLRDMQGLHGSLQATTSQVILTRVLPVTALVFGLLVILGLVWSGQIARPIRRLADAAEKLGAGQLDVEVPPGGNDEIGVLGASFNWMAAQVRELVGHLEQRVAERTTNLERRSMQVQAAAEVARDVSRSLDLDQLLDRAVNLIRSRFGFYHAGIFLVDEIGEYAHLKAATGEAGAQMLQHQHKLRVGKEGLVGFATGKGQPRVALDVGEDAVHFKNPFLPATRSELALPLIAGEKVIGALDVQSDQESAFQEEDVTVLQTMADQLAVAIENTRLVDRLEQSLEETRQLFQQQDRDTWLGVATDGIPKAFEYDLSIVKPAALQLTPEWMSQLKAGKTVVIDQPDRDPALLAVPVILREQVIGVIALENRGELQRWSPDEIAIVEGVAQQAAITLENARLVEESQRKASNERLAGDITRKMRESLNIETVLQSAAREMRRALNLAEAEIRLGLPGEEKLRYEDNPVEGER